MRRLAERGPEGADEVRLGDERDARQGRDVQRLGVGRGPSRRGPAASGGSTPRRRGSPGSLHHVGRLRQGREIPHAAPGLRRYSTSKATLEGRDACVDAARASGVFLTGLGALFVVVILGVTFVLPEVQKLLKLKDDVVRFQKAAQAGPGPFTPPADIQASAAAAGLAAGAAGGGGWSAGVRWLRKRIPLRDSGAGRPRVAAAPERRARDLRGHGLEPGLRPREADQGAPGQAGPPQGLGRGPRRRADPGGRDRVHPQAPACDPHSRHAADEPLLHRR